MGFWDKKPEPEPETVEEVLEGAYGLLQKLEHVEEANTAKAEEAREKAVDLRAKAKYQDKTATVHDTEAGHAKEVLGNFKTLLGVK